MLLSVATKHTEMYAHMGYVPNRTGAAKIQTDGLFVAVILFDLDKGEAARFWSGLPTWIIEFLPRVPCANQETFVRPMSPSSKFVGSVLRHQLRR